MNVDRAQSPVIEVAALAPLLDKATTVLLDCRFSLMNPDAGRSAYALGHIPGARYVHLDLDLAAVPDATQGRHPLPAPEAFAATLGRLGVATDSHVVAYDDAGGAIAARLWWMLRWLGHADVEVLNGGLQAWQAAGLELEGRTPRWSATHYTYDDVNDAAWVATASLQRALENGALLVDARSAPRYAGREEPIDPVAGHVPGATSLPFSDCLDADGCLLAPAQMRELLRERLAGQAGERTIAMCGSGVTACHLLLSLAHAGLPEGRLYAGSWSEWIRDPARPVAREGD